MQIRQLIDQGERTAVICEHIEGIPLSHLMAEPGAITPRRAEQIVGDIARGLSALHEHGIPHGDVSGANVIVGDRAVLIDLIDGGEGTEPYRAPERVGGAALTADALCRCDVWAWGCIAEELGVSVPLSDRALANDPLVRPSMADIVAAQNIDVVATSLPADSSGVDVKAARLLRREADRARTQRRSAPARHTRGRAAKFRPLVASVLLVVAVSAWWVSGPMLEGTWSRAGTSRGNTISSAARTAGKMRDSQSIRADSVSHGTDVKETPETESTVAVGNTERICPIDTDAMQIIADLTARRIEAVTEQNSDALETIYTPDSDGLVSDRELVEALRVNQVEIRDLKASISHVEVLECAELVTIAATLSESAYTRCRSGVCEQIAQGEPRTMQFALNGPPWRVVAIYESAVKTETTS